MKNLIILALIAFGGYQAWKKFEPDPGPELEPVSVSPLFDKPYVAVYGRDSCGFTQRLIQDLQASSVEYHYYIVDEKPVADRLHATMINQGMDVRRYNLPVVDVSGSLSIRPSATDVKIKL
ncbi:MAG: hypothetical protein HOC70_05445 [Gammaproteobacteria bacterium]|jgi:hypothetical protein|nr:hypothetical protein [Gammaproteobacteria bacterium]MBT4492670.1 hypothetical protein [Gammaproteobacteria bacterium]